MLLQLDMSADEDGHLKVRPFKVIQPLERPAEPLLRYRDPRTIVTQLHRPSHVPLASHYGKEESKSPHFNPIPLGLNSAECE